MKYTLILAAILPLLEATLPPVICQACFNTICYTKRKIFEDKLITGQIALDRLYNLLHLHHIDYNSTDHTSVIDLNYDHLRIEDLPIQFSFARAVNQITSEVYFSGYKDIYRYDPVTQQTEHLKKSDKQIWHMQFKDKLYITEYQAKGMHYIVNNITVLIPQLSKYVINDFIIDRKDDIYFVSSYLVYRLEKGYTYPKLFSPIMYLLATDIYDNAYFMDNDARTLYTLNYTRNTLEEVGTFEEGTYVLSMAFDKLNRLVYADGTSDKVFLLTPNNFRCNSGLQNKIVN